MPLPRSPPRNRSRSLGIAGIGTLFFTLAADHGFGAAFSTAELVEAAAALITAAVAATLPSGSPGK